MREQFKTSAFFWIHSSSATLLFFRTKLLNQIHRSLFFKSFLKLVQLWDKVWSFNLVLKWATHICPRFPCNWFRRSDCWAGSWGRCRAWCRGCAFASEELLHPSALHFMWSPKCFDFRLNVSIFVVRCRSIWGRNFFIGFWWREKITSIRVCWW